MSEINKWPCFSKVEADAVSKVLLSNKVNYWTGEEGKKRGWTVNDDDGLNSDM